MTGLTPPATGSETLNEYLRQLQRVVDVLDLRKIPEEGWSLTDLKADVSEVISDKRTVIDVANEAARKLAEVKALITDLDGYNQSLEEARAFKAAAEGLLDWYDQNEVAVQALQEMVSKEGGASQLIAAFDAIRIETNNSATAAKASETAAASSKAAAASSASAASTSKSAAATSATNAKTSETNAANSATAAANSATAAATSETNAKASETAAASSKAAAASSASAASTSKSAAATSATNAKTSETNAANSATAAAGSATAAATSASSISDGAAIATSKAVEASASADRAEAATAGKADLVGGKVPTSQLPAIALTKPFQVSNLDDLLSLDAQEGDIAVFTTPDLKTRGTYILGDGPASNSASWILMNVDSAAPVTSVNGQTGAVTLSASNVGAAPTIHTHTPASIGAAAATHTHTPADVNASFSAAANTIPVRDSAGRLAAFSPVAPGQVANKAYVDQRPALFSGDGAPPASVAGAVVGDFWLNTTTMELSKITGV